MGKRSGRDGMGIGIHLSTVREIGTYAPGLVVPLAGNGHLVLSFSLLFLQNDW